MEATMSQITVFPFQKRLLAIAIGAILTPTATWSINLVQEPPLPTSKSAFVAPNVIISIDDSGSMDWGVKTTQDGPSFIGPGYTEPDSDGKMEKQCKAHQCPQICSKSSI